MKKVQLVFGSGGARGLAHIAIIEWLFSLSKHAVFELMDFTLTKEGFIKGDKIFNKDREMTGELLIEEFDIPFTAVALDIKSGKRSTLPRVIYTTHYGVLLPFPDLLPLIEPKATYSSMAV